MKKLRSIIIIVSLLSSEIYGSSLLKNYQEQIQSKIDNKIPIQVSTFTGFIDSFEKRLEDESQQFMGFKPYIKSIVTFVKNISLQQSVIDVNTISGYGESFTIKALVKIS